MIVETVRCRFCRGKMELAAEGKVLICPACRKATRLPKAQSLSKITQGVLDTPKAKRDLGLQ